MPQLSWNEIQDRAAEFATKWRDETYEKGESQSFWSDFLSVYGIDRKRHGAYFEYAIKKRMAVCRVLSTYFGRASCWQG